MSENMEQKFRLYLANEKCKSCRNENKAEKCADFDECSAPDREYYFAGYKQHEEDIKSSENAGHVHTPRIAVFCKDYGVDFAALGFTASGVFKRIKSIDDINGRNYIGVIKTPDWYCAGRNVIDAHDCLMTLHPELFK